MSELEKAADNHAGRTFVCCMYPDEYDTGKKGDITDYEARKESFIAGAQWQAKQSPWISVEERMPDHMQAVWVRSKINDHQQLRFCDGKFYTSFAHQTYDGGVTHWMPIPE